MAIENQDELQASLLSLTKMLGFDFQRAPLREALNLWKMVSDYMPETNAVFDQDYTKAKAWAMDTLETFINMQLVTGFKRHEMDFFSRADQTRED